MNTPRTEETIFAEALRLAPEERSAFLEKCTEGRAELRQRLEALLESYEAGTFLEAPAAPTIREMLASTIQLTEKAGDTIGRYKLLQQIGEGGCGVVYMAEQEEPVRRRVALKILKLGMDTKSVIARFEAERQALAMMDHPNIAKVFDAGATETGRPYFVMELVRGMKITDYCDEAKLATRERLDLFAQVCQAIQHAHHKGIIHRDIKPSNILVTVNDDVAVPKVIDFGIAKATNGQQLTNKTVFTAFEQFIGTPAYMSPEQAVLTSLDIDTRSDVYALGVLLYELLTGKTPFDPSTLLKAGFDEMRRIIREEEPALPSTCLRSLDPSALTTLAKQRQIEGRKLIVALSGDLDRIVMKALDKDRKRRYDTASALAADVGNYLSDKPVSAVGPGVVYIIRKLLKRHRTGLAFSSMMVVLGLLLLTIQRTGELTRMRLEEAELLGRVITKGGGLSTRQGIQAQVCVTRLANRIQKGESSAEDRSLMARFLTADADLDGPLIQSTKSPVVSFSMGAPWDYRVHKLYKFDGVGLLIRPIITAGNDRIVPSDWIYAKAGAVRRDFDLKKIVTKPGVWQISGTLVAQLVDDQAPGEHSLGGGQDPQYYRAFGDPVQIPLPSIQLTFLQNLPYPLEVPNGEQVKHIVHEMRFVSGALEDKGRDILVGHIQAMLPKTWEGISPLPFALSMWFSQVNGHPIDLFLCNFVNGSFFDTDYDCRLHDEKTIECRLHFTIRREDVRNVPLEENGSLEILIRSSPEVAFQHNELGQILSFPEAKIRVPLVFQRNAGTP